MKFWFLGKELVPYSLVTVHSYNSLFLILMLTGHAGEIERKHFVACHLVAKKRDLYFHRVVLDLEEDVPYA